MGRRGWQRLHADDDPARSARARPGGIASLLRLVDEHGEAIEADLLGVYGIDILDLGSRRLSWRRLRSLISHLPRESALVRAQHGDSAEWGWLEHEVAHLIDIQHEALWVLANQGVKKSKQTPHPDRYPRPGARRHRKQTPEELRARLLDFHRRAAARPRG